jgi:hypothetical protein
VDKVESSEILHLFQVVDESLQVSELIQESGGIVFHVKQESLWMIFHRFILRFEVSVKPRFRLVKTCGSNMLPLSGHPDVGVILYRNRVLRTSS